MWGLWTTRIKSQLERSLKVTSGEIKKEASKSLSFHFVFKIPSAAPSLPKRLQEQAICEVTKGTDTPARCQGVGSAL